MNANVFPPTPSIQKVVSLIEAVPARLIMEASKLNGLGEYQSDVTAQNFLILIIRNVEGLLHLCRQDLLLLPPALNIARPILEIGGNALWLMIPKDPWEREKRLVALLKKEKEERGKYLRNLDEFVVDSYEKEKIENDIKATQQYLESVNKRIPETYSEITKPSFQNLLKDSLLNLSNLYPAYRRLCASTHGSHAITWFYKKEVDGSFGERIDPKDWYTPLYICWWVLAQTGAQFLETFGGDRESYLPKSLREEITNALNRVNSS